MAVSPYMFAKHGASGWPVIYKDAAGESHLGMEGLMGPLSPSEGWYPTGTGWKMISSSQEHALALRSDGTVAGWGSPAYGSWNLPPGVTYTDIAAGRYFSVGLSTDGTIYTVGDDGDKQVSGKPEGSGYLSVVANNETAAALSHDGYIYVWGKPIPGVPSKSVDGGYTDIALGPDYLIAIKEPASELTITGPLSPGKPVSCLESNQYSDGELLIPYGSTIEHTINDVTRIIRPDGTEVGWVNDAEAGNVMTPWGESSLYTDVIMIPDGTYINSTAASTVTFKKAPANKIDETQDTLLNINYLNPVHTTTSNYRHTDATYCSASAPNWVEWASMSTSSIANFRTFNTNWIIPNKPDNTEVGSPRYLDTKRTTVSSWNGLENTNGILQAVPAWNWHYKGSSDTYLNFDKQWSWAVWGEDTTHGLTFLTTPQYLAEGDSFYGDYTVRDSSSTSTTWGINAGNSSSAIGMLWSTSDLTRDNVDLEVAEEAYLLVQSGTHHSTVWDAKYFPKNTKFTDFVIQDADGKTISPVFNGCLSKEWGQNISTLKTEITTNPYAITLHTTS